MNQTSADKERNKAKEASFHLLKIRLRSEHELREKLKLKKFSKSIINETIQFLLDNVFWMIQFLPKVGLDHVSINHMV